MIESGTGGSLAELPFFHESIDSFSYPATIRIGSVRPWMNKANFFLCIFTIKIQGFSLVAFSLVLRQWGSGGFGSFLPLVCKSGGNFCRGLLEGIDVVLVLFFASWLLHPCDEV